MIAKKQRASKLSSIVYRYICIASSDNNWPATSLTRFQCAKWGSKKSTCSTTKRDKEKLWVVNLSFWQIQRKQIKDRRRYDVLIDVPLMWQRLHLVRHDGHVLLTLEDAVGVSGLCLHNMHVFTLIYSRSPHLQSGEHQIRLSVVVVVRFIPGHEYHQMRLSVVVLFFLDFKSKSRWGLSVVVVILCNSKCGYHQMMLSFFWVFFWFFSPFFWAGVEFWWGDGGCISGQRVTTGPTTTPTCLCWASCFLLKHVFCFVVIICLAYKVSDVWIWINGTYNHTCAWKGTQPTFFLYNNRDTDPS